MGGHVFEKSATDYLLLWADMFLKKVPIICSFFYLLMAMLWGFGAVGVAG